MLPMRLQKYLSEAGVCSRRTAEACIRQGRVRVNGQVVTRLGTKVTPDTDRVEVDGRPARIQARPLYIVLNKPKGYVTSCRHAGQPIVLDLIDLPDRVFPVGRLDKDSTGLLLLTNDGSLHLRLSHPSFEHEKEYDVTVAHPISDSALDRMRRGMPMDETVTKAARVLRRGPRRFRIVLMEGKKRQIRRMVQMVGNRVTRLQRLRVAHIRLGSLKEGQWRHLTASEKKLLLRYRDGPPDSPVSAARRNL